MTPPKIDITLVLRTSAPRSAGGIFLGTEEALWCHMGKKWKRKERKERTGARAQHRANRSRTGEMKGGKPEATRTHGAHNRRPTNAAGAAASQARRDDVAVSLHRLSVGVAVALSRAGLGLAVALSRAGVGVAVFPFRCRLLYESRA